MNTWPDGTPKSRGNAFDLSGHSNIAESISRGASHSQNSSAVVNRKRKQGVDMSTIPGLCKKQPAHDTDPKRFHVYSRAKP